MQLAHFEPRMTQKEAAQEFLIQHLKGRKTGKKYVGME